MFSKVSIFAVLAVGAYLSASNHGAEALKCYLCNTTATAACGYNPLNTTNIETETCPANSQCFALTSAWITDTSNNYTWRGCIEDELTCDQMNSTSSSAAIILTGCTLCSKDLCNSVNSATVFAVPLVALVVSFLAVKYVQ